MTNERSQGDQGPTRQAGRAADLRRPRVVGSLSHTELRACIQALLAAVGRYSTTPAALDEDIQQRARAVCMVARDNGMNAEDILILLRAEWTAGVDKGCNHSRDSESLRGRVASLCIAEFYS